MEVGHKAHLLYKITLSNNNFVIEKNKSKTIIVEIKWLNLKDNDTEDTYIGQNINNLNVCFDINATQVNNPKIVINNDYDIYNLKGKKTNNANIFGDTEIAPGDSGIYKFNVLNNSDEELNYKLKFNETNPSNISMKYKIKLNGNYISNEWSNLNDINEIINTNEFDTYELEWKWFNSDNDSKITEDSTYKLNIAIESNGIKKRSK